MKEFREIEAWRMNFAPDAHETLLVESLPDPIFRYKNKPLISFSTNNYLGLATSERLVKAAQYGLSKFGVGNCESRLLGGDLEIYRKVEAKLAKMKKKDDAVLYATGFLTNLGVLNSLVKAPQIARFYGYRPAVRRKFTYFTDELNHLSIREGIRMSEAEKFSYRHLDLNHLESLLKRCESQTKVIVTDGVFSQDGDIAPLPGLVELAEKYDAMVYVDDAHGTGVLGETGGGISEHFNCYSERLIHMGTLSKAYGAIGGFVAAERSICDLLRFTSSAYGFTSTLPPDQAYAVSEAIEMVRDEPIRRQTLWANQKKMVKLLINESFNVICTDTPIVPVLIGDESEAETYAQNLRDLGYYLDAVKFPAVGKGQSRLRIMLNANHTSEQIEGLVSALVSVRAQFKGSAVSSVAKGPAELLQIG